MGQRVRYFYQSDNCTPDKYIDTALTYLSVLLSIIENEPTLKNYFFLPPILVSFDTNLSFFDASSEPNKTPLYILVPVFFRGLD